MSLSAKLSGAAKLFFVFSRKFSLQFDVLCVVLCSGNCCVFSVSVFIFFAGWVFFINLLHRKNLLHLTPLPRFTATSSSMGVFHLSSDRPSAGRETCTPARSRNSKTLKKLLNKVEQRQSFNPRQQVRFCTSFGSFDEKPSNSVCPYLLKTNFCQAYIEGKGNNHCIACPL